MTSQLRLWPGMPVHVDCEPSDRRLTPPWVLEAVQEMAQGPIALDPCTEPDNPTRALAYLTFAGLEADWDTHAWWALPAERSPGWLSVIWLNPPFSQMEAWVDKVASEDRCTRLLFTATDTTTGWWWDLEDKYALARCGLRRRPRCLDPETGRVMDVARCAVVWLLSDSMRALARFRAALSPLGRVEGLR